MIELLSVRIKFICSSFLDCAINSHFWHLMIELDGFIFSYFCQLGMIKKKKKKKLKSYCVFLSLLFVYKKSSTI